MDISKEPHCEEKHEACILKNQSITDPAQKVDCKKEYNNCNVINSQYLLLQKLIKQYPKKNFDFENESGLIYTDQGHVMELISNDFLTKQKLFGDFKFRKLSRPYVINCGNYTRVWRLPNEDLSIRLNLYEKGIKFLKKLGQKQFTHHVAQSPETEAGFLRLKGKEYSVLIAPYIEEERTDMKSPHGKFFWGLGRGHAIHYKRFTNIQKQLRSKNSDKTCTLLGTIDMDLDRQFYDLDTDNDRIVDGKKQEDWKRSQRQAIGLKRLLANYRAQTHRETIEKRQERINYLQNAIKSNDTTNHWKAKFQQELDKLLAMKS